MFSLVFASNNCRTEQAVRLWVKWDTLMLMLHHGNAFKSISYPLQWSSGGYNGFNIFICLSVICPWLEVSVWKISWIFFVLNNSAYHMCHVWCIWCNIYFSIWIFGQSESFNSLQIPWQWNLTVVPYGMYDFSAGKFTVVDLLHNGQLILTFNTQCFKI